MTLRVAAQEVLQSEQGLWHLVQQCPATAAKPDLQPDKAFKQFHTGIEKVIIDGATCGLRLFQVWKRLRR